MYWSDDILIAAWRKIADLRDTVYSHHADKILRHAQFYIECHTEQVSNLDVIYPN